MAQIPHQEKRNIQPPTHPHTHKVLIFVPSQRSKQKRTQNTEL